MGVDYLLGLICRTPHWGWAWTRLWSRDDCYPAKQSDLWDTQTHRQRMTSPDQPNIETLNLVSCQEDMCYISPFSKSGTFISWKFWGPSCSMGNTFNDSGTVTQLCVFGHSFSIHFADWRSGGFGHCFNGVMALWRTARDLRGFLWFKELLL